MGIIVSKFGGTSLADARQFLKVRSIIRHDGRRRYIITSAPGKRNPNDQKITDLLYLCHTHASNGVPFDEVYDIISSRYLEIVRELELSLDIRHYLDEIKENIAGGFSSDYTASRGEYLSGLILAELLEYDFVDPADMIFFNASGSLNQEKTDEAVKRVLAGHECAVIPGFYGTKPDGGIKTFSRGGSDISGAIIAKAVGAELYENWTDVPGFLMADPKIVNNPKPIERITYRELRELAYMGANVLHEEAIFPVRQAGIPVKIKDTNDPKAPGTLIIRDNDNTEQKGVITGIAGKRNFTVIAIEKALMNIELGFGRKLLSIMEANGISFEHMPSGIDSISLVVEDKQLEGKLDIVLEEIKQQLKPDSMVVHPNMALIATVGRGMSRTPGIAARLFTALANEGINIRMIDQGSSEINIIIGVETEDFEKAVRAIYKVFVE